MKSKKRQVKKVYPEKTKFYQASFEELKESKIDELKYSIARDVVKKGLEGLKNGFELEVHYTVEKNIFKDDTEEYEREDVYTNIESLEEAYKLMLEVLDSSPDWCSKDEYDEREKSYVSIWEEYDISYEKDGKYEEYSHDFISIYSVYIEPERQEDDKEIAKYILEELDLEDLEDYSYIEEAFEDYYSAGTYKDGGYSREQKWFNSLNETIQKIIIAIDEGVNKLEKCETAKEYIEMYDDVFNEVEKACSEIISK